MKLQRLAIFVVTTLLFISGCNRHMGGYPKLTAADKKKLKRHEKTKPLQDSTTSSPHIH